MLKILAFVCLMIPALSFACDKYHEMLTHEYTQMMECQKIVSLQHNSWLIGYCQGLERALDIYEAQCCDETDGLCNLKSD